MIKTWDEFLLSEAIAKETDAAEQVLFSEETHDLTTEAKVPKKYLTHNPKAMKKEIKKYKGKDTYKKDWEADYDKGTGKRIKTKKSASSIAYQKKFGNKNEALTII